MVIDDKAAKKMMSSGWKLLDYYNLDFSREESKKMKVRKSLEK